MPSVHLDHVSFSYTSIVDVFNDVTLHLGPGWFGVVGPNGMGKTTLLSLVAGALVPSSGSLRIEPVSAPPILCDQEVERPDAAIVAFAIDTAGTSRRWIGLLQLDPGDFDRWPTLSPGERKRWQVAAALAAEPAVLLLDEPTNHLDTEARELLLGSLRRFGGVGVVVSHDRAFLDALTTTTLRVRSGRVEVWSGGYSAARREWEADAAEAREARERARGRARRARTRLHRASRDRASAEAGMKREMRTADVKDHDARGMARKGRLRGAEKRLGREVAVRRDALARAEEDLDRHRVEKDPGGAIRFEGEPADRDWLASLDADVLEVGGRPLLHDVHLGVRRDDRIRVTGRNGAGKTTLLRAVLAAARLPADRVLHLPQDLSAEDAAATLEAVRRLPPEPRGRLLSLVAALGVDPDRLLASEAPSPGEARKVRMAYGLATGAWLLVLDEPTNHLDLPAIERLEQALAAYPGALLLVTHDAALAEKLTGTTWHVEDGRVEER